MSKKITTEIVSQAAEERGYTLLSEYRSSSEKIKLKCKNGHIWWVTWNNFHTKKS